MKAWRLSSALVILLAALATVLADDSSDEGSVVSSDPVFTALRVDGTTVSGQIRQLGPDGNVTLVVEGEDRVLALRELVKLTGDDPTLPAVPEGSSVLLPDGDRLRALIGSAEETTLDVRSYILGDVAIPLDSLLGLVLNPPEDPEALEALMMRVRNEPRNAEVLWLTNGDRLEGGFLGLDHQTVAFQPAGDRVEMNRAAVLALGFDPALVNYPEPASGFLELTLSDGSRLGVTDTRIDHGHLRATTRFGAEIRLALGDLARVHVRGDQLVYLSDQPEAGVQYVPYLGPVRPFQRNANVEGRPLRLGGQPHDRGLGTQSRTLLAYRLGPDDRRFQALVGLDDRAGPLGNVVFRVLVDGQERFASPPMSARDEPCAIDVDVSGGRVVILVTEFGKRGDIQDHANWVEARLIR